MTDSPDSLFRQIAGHAGDALPPVHRWHPADVKDIELRVSRDGTWWHQGSPVRRERLVRLFSRVLRREGTDYFLVIPVEKVRLDVEVVPLLAVCMELRQGGEGPDIAFQTNTGDIVIADRDHPIRLRGTQDEPLPVVEVRDGIEALITQRVFYELVNRSSVAFSEGCEVLVVRSRGESFELGTIYHIIEGSG